MGDGIIHMAPTAESEKHKYEAYALHDIFRYIAKEVSD